MTTAEGCHRITDGASRTSETGGATAARRAQHGTGPNGVWPSGLRGGSGGLACCGRQVKCAAGVGGDGDLIGVARVSYPRPEFIDQLDSALGDLRKQLNTSADYCRTFWRV